MSMAQADEVGLPKASVNKLINEVLPNGVKCAAETREMLLDCCNEFIHLIATEATDIAENEKKKVLSPEHVLRGLKSLGFEDYIPEVESVFEDYKKQESGKPKRQKKKLEDLGISHEELLREQQRLFAQARSFNEDNTNNVDEGEQES